MNPMPPPRRPSVPASPSASILTASRPSMPRPPSASGLLTSGQSALAAAVSSASAPRRPSGDSSFSPYAPLPSASAPALGIPAPVSQQTANVSERMRAVTEQSSGGCFTLMSADDATYISALKSDIFQLQMTLDRLSTSAGPSSPKGAVSSRGASRLRAEISSIKQGSNDMEVLLKDADSVEPNIVKLRLFELLNAKMIQMEMRLVGSTERVGTKPTTPYGFPTLSRLPSFMALTERVADMTSQLEAGAGSNAAPSLVLPGQRRPSSAYAHSSSPVLERSREVGEALAELEEHAWSMAKQLSLPKSALPELSNPASSPTNVGADDQIVDWLSRLQRLSRYLECVQEKGITTLSDELAASKDTQRRLHEGLASNAKQLSELKSEKERAEASAAQLPQLQRDQEARLQSVQASLSADLELARTQAATLQKQLDDNRAALNEARDEGRASADELVEVQRAVRHLQQQLNDEIAQRRNAEYAHFQALEAAHAEHESAERDVQTELLSAQQTVAELRQTGAATQLQLEQLQAQLDESRAAMASMGGRASEEASAHTQQLEAVQRRLELAQQRVAMLEKADSERDRMPTARTVASSEQMETLKQMNAQLRSELDEANSQLIKQRRQQTSADAARADAAAEHERQMEESRASVARVRAEAQRERETHAELMELKENHIATLSQRLARPKGDFDDSFEEVLREELRMMKAAYEVKMNKLKEENSRIALESNQNYRKMVDKFTGEQRMLESKLRQYAANSNAPADSPKAAKSF